MLTWLERKFFSWSVDKQKKELETWLGMLRAMNSDEIGAVVAIATHIRHGLEKTYLVNLLDPVVTASLSPNLVFTLHKWIKEYQSRGDRSSAAGVMVWLHTIRCGTSLELRQHGRELWRELQRGFPFAVASAQGIYSISGVMLNTQGSGSVPTGLEPERQ